MRLKYTFGRLGLLRINDDLPCFLSRCFKYDNLVGCSCTCPRFYIGSSIYILFIFFIVCWSFQQPLEVQCCLFKVQVDFVNILDMTYLLLWEQQASDKD